MRKIVDENSKNDIYASCYQFNAESTEKSGLL
jgi:hypothetical protein